MSDTLWGQRLAGSNSATLQVDGDEACTLFGIGIPDWIRLPTDSVFGVRWSERQVRPHYAAPGKCVREDCALPARWWDIDAPYSCCECAVHGFQWFAADDDPDVQQLLVLNPDGKIDVLPRPAKKDTLATLQKACGGYIEGLHHGHLSYRGRPITAYADEEGRLNGALPNPLAVTFLRYPGALFGPVAVLRNWVLG